MEFGVFLNGYTPGPAAHSTELEHTELTREAQYVIFADKHNWKYAWLGEHHSLTEYSHLSAPEVVMGYIAYVSQASSVATLGVPNLGSGEVLGRWVAEETPGRCCIERSPRPAASTRPPKQSRLWARSRVPSRFLVLPRGGEPPLRRA